jgi:Ca2+/H+ antiporter
VDPDHGTFLVSGNGTVVEVNIAMSVQSGPQIPLTDELVLGIVAVGAAGGAGIAIAIRRHRRKGP